MRYSIEPRDRIYLKGYGFLSFDKNMDKSLSNKYGQKLLDSAKKSTTDAIKTALNNNNNDDDDEDVELTTHKKRSISPEERQQIINELKLVPNLANSNKFKLNINAKI